MFKSLLLIVLFAAMISAYAELEAVEATPTGCPVKENETIVVVMERICEMCHEFSSHTQPNLRSDCRANCFTTDTFRRCLAVFTPRKHTRHLHRHPHNKAV